MCIFGNPDCGEGGIWDNYTGNMEFGLEIVDSLNGLDVREGGRTDEGNGCEEYVSDEVMEIQDEMYGREIVEKQYERPLGPIVDGANGEKLEKVQSVTEMCIADRCEGSVNIDTEILDLLKQNKCVTCGRVCENVHYLRRHLTTHSKERKFKCTYAGCGKSYKYKCDVKRHFSDVHEVVLMFKCKHGDCKERFECKSKAHSHEKKCEFKKKLKCPNFGCKCILSSLSAFNKHKELCAINRAKVIEEMKRLKETNA